MSFFTDHLKTIIVFGIVILLLATTDPVVALPYSIDSILSVFLGTIGTLANTIDFLEVPLKLLLFSFTLEIALFSWKWIRFFISLYK